MGQWKIMERHIIIINNYTMKYSVGDDKILVSMPNFSWTLNKNDGQISIELKLILEKRGWNKTAMSALENILYPKDDKYRDWRLYLDDGYSQIM